MQATPAPKPTARGERFRTTPIMRFAFWCLQVPPLYAAIVLFLPYPTFVLSPGYALLAQIGTERTWALISLCVPAFAVFAWWRRTDNSISTALMLSGMWHGVIGLMILLAAPMSVVPGGLIVLAILNCLLAMRI